jgi:hypothetical protein
MNSSFLSRRLVLLLLSAGLSYCASAQSFAWAKNYNNLSDDIGRGIAATSDGNVYSVGSFDGSLDFVSPGVGVSSKGLYDGYLLKQKPDGSTAWGRSYGGSGIDVAYAVATDKGGNAYVAGSFTGTATFGSTTLTSAGANDAFVLKVNASGDLLWVKQLGGGGTDEAFCVATDKDGNVYVGGCFSATADLDPGAATANYTSKGNRDAFVEKLDPSGSLVWVATMGGSTIDEFAYGVHVDGAGNVLTTGPYMGPADFDPGAGVYNLNGSGAYIQKLDAGGHFVWANSLDNATGYAITSDGSNNAILTGIFWPTGPGSVTDFDPGAGTYNIASNGSNDAFVLKLLPDGKFAWAKRIGGVAIEWAYGVAADAQGNVYSTGSFDSLVDFDPGPGVKNLSGDVVDIYIQKLDAAGNLVWAKRFGDHCADEGMAIALDGQNNIYTTGHFQSAVLFDAATNCTLTGNYGNDLFVLKMAQEPTGIGSVRSAPQVVIYPNPSVAGKSILLFNKAYRDINITVTDAAGRLVMSFHASNSTRVDLPSDAVPGRGAYFVSVRTEEGSTVLPMQVL